VTSDGTQSFPSTSDRPHAHDSNPTYDLDWVKQRLRELSGQAAITVRNRADGFTANTKTTLSQLGFHLNKVTGYEAIEALKRDVVDQGVYVCCLLLYFQTSILHISEAKINVTRQAARQAKTAYEQAVIQRSNSQREVNDLLQRKSNWTDSDVSRFTTLVRQDHSYEQEEARAKAAVDETEDAVEREFSQLMRTILARYHEEQVWSDKIRSASTYGSLAALGLNMLVFVMAIVVVEPWKRRRLAQTFEKKIEELSVENAGRLDASMAAIGRQLADQERILSKVTQDLSGKLSSTLEEAKPEATPTTIDVSPEPVEVIVGRNDWELAAVAAGAFIAGVLGSLWLAR
jgi:sensitive to high expression protein 9, mitochondrial